MLHRTLGLFDQDTRHRKLEALGDPLVVLNKIVPWEMFREPLEATRSEARRSAGVRRGADVQDSGVARDVRAVG